MLGDTLPGWAPGVVIDNEDPEGRRRVRCRIDGLYEETPFWIMPAQSPGAGGVGRGSDYPPPPVDAQVYILFQYGQYQGQGVQAIYLPGDYGFNPDMTYAGPSVVGSAAKEDIDGTVCLWEDDKFLVFIRNTETEKKLLLQTRAGSKVEIDAAAGTGGNSETIVVEARTMVSLYSTGLVDIRGGVVQINGRRVKKAGGAI